MLIKQLKLRKSSTHAKNALTQNQAQMLLKSITGTDEKSRRDRAVNPAAEHEYEKRTCQYAAHLRQDLYDNTCRFQRNDSDCRHDLPE